MLALCCVVAHQAGVVERLVTRKPGPGAGRRSGHLHQGTEQGSSEQGRTASPVRAQPQKSLLPHSVGYKRISSLLRLKAGEHRPRPQLGGASKTPHSTGGVGDRKTPPGTHTLLDFAADLGHRLHPSHLFIMKQLGYSSKRQGSVDIPRSFGG